MSATAPVAGPRPDIVFQAIGASAALFDPMRRRIFALGPPEAVA